jgi:N-acetylglucosamine-6-phosphate deacetylase
VIVQAILDGHHLAEETARVVWRAAAGRVALVSDAIAATGLGNGRSRLGDVTVVVDDGVVRREDGVLAGSVLTMLQAVRNLHALDVPLVDAVAAATSVPARALRRDDVGTLRPGGAADLVVLDDRLELRTVLVAGSAQVAA